MKLGSIVIAFVLVVLTSAGLVAQSGNDLYQRALVKERTGSYQEAVALYQTIVDKHAADKKLLAKALYRMGQAYEKLDKIPEARRAYSRITGELPDQKEVSADARSRLTALSSLSPSDRQDRLICSDCGFERDSISADGRVLAFSRNDDLLVRDNVSGQVTTILNRSDRVTFRYPLLSPDAKQIAYVRRVSPGTFPDLSYDDDLEIVANEAGARPRILNSNPEYETIVPAAWAADGKSILSFVGKRVDRTWAIAWVSTSDGTVRELRSIGWHFDSALGRPSLSPDGRLIAYSALVNEERPGVGPSPLLTSESPVVADAHIYILPVDGSLPERELVKGASRNEAPVWSRDGRSLLFVSNRGGVNWGLWSVSVQGGALRQIGGITGRILPLGMTSEGTYYYRQPEPVGSTSLGSNVGASFLVSAELSAGQGGGQTSATISGANPSWSPDGKFVAFTRDIDLRSSGQMVRRSNLFVYSLDTKDEKRYVVPGVISPIGGPRWLNDGSGLLINTGEVRDGTLYRVDLKTEKATAVFSGLPFSAPASNSNTLYAVRETDESRADAPGCDVRRLVSVDIASGVERPIITMARPLFHSPAFDDSRTLFVRACTRITNGRFYSQRIVAVDVTTGRQRDVLAVPDPRSFESHALSPDGRTLAAVIVDDVEARNAVRRIVRFEVDGTGYQELYVSPTVRQPFDMLKWAPDGAAISWCETDRCLRPMKVSAKGGAPEAMTPGLLSPEGSHVLTIPDTRNAARELRAIDNVSSLPNTVR